MAFRQMVSRSRGIASSSRRGRGRLILLDPDQKHPLAPLERPHARQELVEDDAQAVDVGPRVDHSGLAAHLLGGHVCRSPDELAIDRKRRIACIALGQSEVGQKNPVLAVDEDIRRLDVAVDDAGPVGMIQRLGQRGDPFNGLPNARAAGRKLVGQISTLDQGGDQVQMPVNLAGVVHRDDTRVPQDAGRAGLAEEPVDGTGRVQRPRAAAA